MLIECPPVWADKQTDEEEETELIFLDLSDLSGTISLAGAEVSIKVMGTTRI